MDRKVVTRRKGQKGSVVSHIEYTCRNPVSGCNYKVESTLMANTEMIPIREPLPEPPAEPVAEEVAAE